MILEAHKERMKGIEIKKEAEAKRVQGATDENKRWSLPMTTVLIPGLTGLFEPPNKRFIPSKRLDA